MSQESNKYCADCGQKGTRWASWNIGCFICIRCGGIHRKLGTHISKVKSVTLDSWTPEQMESIVEKGNTKVNELYKCNPQSHPPPSSDVQLEQYIRDKYERNLYREGGSRTYNDAYSSSRNTGSTSHRTYDGFGSSNNNGVPNNGYSSRNANSYSDRGGSSDFDREIVQLRDMGFTNKDLCIRALRESRGNVQSAVEYLIANAPADEDPSKPKSRGEQVALQQFRSMGFNDDTASLDAFRRANGAMDNAISKLVENRRKSAVPKPTQSSTSANNPFSQPSSSGFADFSSASLPPPPSGGGGFTAAPVQRQQQQPAPQQPPAPSQPGQQLMDLLGGDIVETPQQASNVANPFAQQAQPIPPPDTKKDDIMSLFGSNPSQQQPAGGMMQMMPGMAQPGMPGMGQYGVPQMAQQQPGGGMMQMMPGMAQPGMAQPGMAQPGMPGGLMQPGMGMMGQAMPGGMMQYGMMGQAMPGGMMQQPGYSTVSQQAMPGFGGIQQQISQPRQANGFGAAPPNTMGGFQQPSNAQQPGIFDAPAQQQPAKPDPFSGLNPMNNAGGNGGGKQQNPFGGLI